MAFNVGKFVKSTAKSAANRMLDEVVSAVTSKLPISTSLSAKSTVNSLFNVGASFDSISAFASQKTDSLISGGAEKYFALAGKDPARTAAADIENLRHSGLDKNVSFFLNEVNPSTKIKLKKQEAAGAVDDLTATDKVELP